MLAVFQNDDNDDCPAPKALVFLHFGQLKTRAGTFQRPANPQPTTHAFLKQIILENFIFMF